MCGFASGGINIVKFIFSPAICSTYSPSICVVASTFNFSDDWELPSDDTTGSSPSVLQANITNDEIIKLNLSKFLNIYDSF